MRGSIVKLDPIKYSRNGGDSFIRVKFKLEDGSFAMTDLVPSYRNYPRWKDLLVVGKDLDNLTLKSKGKIDADSFPNVVKPFVDGEWKSMPDGSMEFVRKAYIPEPLPPLPVEEKKLIQAKLI